MRFIKDYSLVTKHYAEDYFEKYQKSIGEFGGIANLFKFQQHIKPTDTVLDFGCGGGFLLANIDCAKKIGIEISDVARAYCNQKMNIECFDSLDLIEDESVDVIISNHCLEHVANPYEIIEQMYKKLRNNGRLIIVVPLDSYKYSFKKNDVNNHLYSFSPMNLGNLFQAAGFKNIQTEPLLHKWPPLYRKLHSTFGDSAYHLLCRIYGRLNKRFVQTKGIGVKKVD